MLAWVGNGVPIQLVRPICETWQSYSLQAEQQAWIEVEVEWLWRMGVVEWMGTGSEQPMGIDFVCPIMCVPKKGLKCWWMVHNLHDLNCGLVLRTVHFEGLASLAWMVSARWWLISFDLAQGYHHMLMEEDAHQLLGFKVGQHWYCYHVLLFSLQWSLWIFMKVVKAVTTFWWCQGIICMAYINGRKQCRPDTDGQESVDGAASKWLRELHGPVDSWGDQEPGGQCTVAAGQPRRLDTAG